MDTIPAPLKGKVAIITGGSRGIGAALVRKFAENGCSHIAITYNTNKDLAEKVLASVHKLNPKIKTCAFAADLSDPDFGPKVVKQALAGLATDWIDIVVSNAAPNATSDLVEVESMTKKDFDFHITGSAWASLSLAKATIKHIPCGGRIIMMSAVASKFAFGEPTVAYSAAKAAVDSISKNLAAIWGPKYGVTVNTISVGGTMTDAMRAAIGARGPDFEKMVGDLSFLKRIGEVDEVADIVAFVASPQARWIVGKSEMTWTDITPVNRLTWVNRQPNSSQRRWSLPGPELKLCSLGNSDQR